MTVVVADGSVWHVSSPQPEGSAFWPAWTSLGQPGGAAAMAASAAALADNRTEVFAVEIPSGSPGVGFGVYGKLWHRWQEAAGGTQWSGWESLGMPNGKPVSAPTLAEHQGGRLELFAVTDDAHVWHRVLRTATDPRSWSPWAALPATVWHTAQTAADAGTWTPWSELATVPGPVATDGGKLGAPAVGFNHAGLVEIFVVNGIGGELHHLQATASGQLTLGPQTFPQP